MSELVRDQSGNVLWAAACPATREAVEDAEEWGEIGCPLCGRAAQHHRDEEGGVPTLSEQYNRLGSTDSEGRYARLATQHDAEPTVPDHGGGVTGDRYPLVGADG